MCGLHSVTLLSAYLSVVGQSVCLSLRPSIRLARRVSNAVEIVEKPESDSSGEDRYCDEGDSKMRSYPTNLVQ